MSDTDDNAFRKPVPSSIEIIQSTGPICFGDEDEYEEEHEEEEEEEGEIIEDITWFEVYEACCMRTPLEWAYALKQLCAVAFFLYFFLFALELMATSAKVMTGCTAGDLFGDDANPVAGVMVGLLCTALIQSSSTTTSIFVSLVGSAISLRQAIYMIMGANVGTTLTNTLVSLSQLGDAEQLERAFAGATVHDMFNLMTVSILLPLEVATGYLRRITGFMIRNASTSETGGWKGPAKKFVAPLSERIIRSNSDLIKTIGEGNGSCDVGGGFYPISCEPGTPTASKCTQVGLISCDSIRNTCPLFFQVDATAKDDRVSGGVVFSLSLLLLFTCLFALVKILLQMLMGLSTGVVFKATKVNGYVAMVAGCAITVLVQSSAVVTSTLTPLVGIGAIHLNQMYPLTLGSNLGTTFTALLASMVTEGIAPLQVALCHLFFNVTGIVIFYPIPFMRALPLGAARRLGKAARQWRGFPFLYICFTFFVLPIVCLGISFLFADGSKGLTVIGSFAVVTLVLSCAYCFYWWSYKDGKQFCIARFERRQHVRHVMKNLPDDMEFLKAKVAALMEHTGLHEDDGR